MLTARETLERMLDDDSRRVSAAAEAALTPLSEEEEARRKAEEEEEEEEGRRKAEEEAGRRKAEEEEAGRRKAEDEEAGRRKAEEDKARSKAEEDKAGRRAEESFRSARFGMLEVGWFTSKPVRLLTVNDVRYFVLPNGREPWVQKMRASGNVRLAGKRISVTEFADDEKPALLRAFLEATEGLLSGARADATDEELRRVAPNHPVFRID